MRKTVQKTHNFLNKTVKTDDLTKDLQARSPDHAPIIAIPVIELTENEKRAIQKILVDEYHPGVIADIQIAQHIEQLINITKQIKSITVQSVLLHGERITQAQKLLANYKDGAFSKWLLVTYGNRQTPYSMLRYYEFYQSAPEETRPMIEAAPKKCMYALASREVDLIKKLEGVKNNCNKSQADFLESIQSMFPTAQAGKRESVKNKSTLNSMDTLLIKLKSGAQYLNEYHKAEIERLIRHLQKLIG